MVLFTDESKKRVVDITWNMAQTSSELLRIIEDDNDDTDEPVRVSFEGTLT
jgi:hypothetical protein